MCDSDSAIYYLLTSFWSKIYLTKSYLKTRYVVKVSPSFLGNLLGGGSCSFIKAKIEYLPADFMHSGLETFQKMATLRQVIPILSID